MDGFMTDVNTHGHRESVLRTHTWRGDREALGSNPGPPTNFVFKIDDFLCGLESAAHLRITISCRPTKPGAGVKASVAGNLRSRDRESLGKQRPRRQTHGAGP